MAASVHSIAAASVKVLELPDLPPGGDLSDWLKGRLPADAAEDLCRLADQAATWKTVDEVDPQPAEGQPEDHWQWLDVHDIEKWEVEPLQPVVDGLFARGNFVIMAAASQTGKTLLALYLARKLLAGGELFEKFTVHPVGKLLYLCLEDPARRIKDRLLDIAHEFDGPPEPGQFIVHVAPGLSITDEEAGDQLETMARTFDVVILDTYQKATPGVSSFNDEQQSHILHRLSNMTRKTGVTLIVLDHIRKDDNRNSRKDLSLDDIKGTGGKVQNADSIILLERSGRQLKLKASSKDFDEEVGILLNISPQGSGAPKFEYAGELDQMATSSKEKGERNRQAVLDAMVPDEWISSTDLAGRVDFTPETVRKHLEYWVEEGSVDKMGEKRWTKYCLTITQE